MSAALRAGFCFEAAKRCARMIGSDRTAFDRDQTRQLAATWLAAAIFWRTIAEHEARGVVVGSVGVA